MQPRKQMEFFYYLFNYAILLNGSKGFLFELIKCVIMKGGCGKRTQTKFEFVTECPASSYRHLDSLSEE